MKNWQPLWTRLGSSDFPLLLTHTPMKLHAERFWLGCAPSNMAQIYATKLCAS